MVRFINLLKKFFGLKTRPAFSEVNWLLEQIELRRKEWQEAWLGFHQCETADNDYWIFKLKTAER
ncbi:MAG: hypothetical protein MJ157_03935, partial [Clostridia bacterium]|nr:hypothetical protein [Clostridia bacterium]